jgi:phosphoglycerate dehydrogenase-like enzyme
MRILVHLDNPVRAFELNAEQLSALKERFPSHEFVRVHSQDDFLRELPSAEGALVWSFEASWYALAPKLRFVATPAAGRERVARDPAGRVRQLHGSFHGKIMGEALLAMMLFWSRRLDLAIQHRRERRYERDHLSETRRLAGQHALIVGYGPLGREIAQRLKALGMQVVGVKRDAGVDRGPADAVMPVTLLHALLRQADHVVVTLPSDTGTDHLFDEKAFAQMKKSAYFYNLGRGNAVDEEALVAALSSGGIAGAFLDVFEQEPLPADSPLWTAPNLEFLPHASAVSREYLDLWIDELAPELSKAS